MWRRIFHCHITTIRKEKVVGLAACSVYAYKELGIRSLTWRYTQTLAPKQTQMEIATTVSDSESGYSSPNEDKKNHRYNTSNLINVTCSTQLLSDEIDAGTTDCIEKGNVVSMRVNMDGTDMYMAVNMQQIVTQATAIADSENTLFTWKNLINTDFGIVLQNDSLYKGRVVGVEKFANDVPLTLQCQSGSSNNYVLYKRDLKNGYFCLWLKSPDNQFFYVLPSKEGDPLKIHSVDQLKKEFKDRNSYVFKYAISKCSNPEGPCRFQRLTG